LGQEIGIKARNSRKGQTQGDLFNGGDKWEKRREERRDQL